MANIKSLHVPKEHKLTLTPDAFASGHLVRVYSGSQPTDFTTITASTVVVLGPFNEPRDYRVTEVSGSITSALSFDGTDENEIETYLEDYVRNDEPEENVVSVTDTATGGELETAINGILAILVAKGLMEPEPEEE